MSIKASCSCGFAFAVKDEFAGRRVKCPKCNSPVSIPGRLVEPAIDPVKAQAAVAEPASKKGTRTVSPSGTVANIGAKKTPLSPPKVERKAKSPVNNEVVWNRSEKFNPVLDLLDEAGVKRAAAGPVCPHCEAEMSPTAIICVHCGFNKESGERLETFSDVKDERMTGSTHVENDTDLILAKAERDINNAPNSALNQDFGDGSDSIVVALGALLGFGLIIVAGVLTVLVMDRLQEQADPALVSFVTSTALVVGCYLYITYTAFRMSMIQGIICAVTVQYCVVFAFIQGRSLLLFGIVMQIALIISAVAGYFRFS